MKGWRLLAASAVAGLLAVTSASAQAPIKVLFWGGTTTTPHNPTAMRDSLAAFFTTNNIQISYRSAASPVWLHPDTLAQFDVMLAYTTNQNAADMTTAQINSLIAWLESGRVMVALHGTTNTYFNGNATVATAWRLLTGARFVDHDAPNHAGTCTFRQPLHGSLEGATPLPASLTADPGASSTQYWDEGRRHNQYVSDTIVIARAQLATTNVPWIWVRPQGQGWVYYNASGHNHLTWQRPEFRSQLLRALTWGYQMKVTGIRGREALAQFLGGPHGHIVVPSNAGFRSGHSIEILDMQGRRVFHRSRSRAQSHDVNFLPAGTYGVNILSEASEAFKSLYVKPR